MALFSQRQGIRPLEKVLQRASIEPDLRNRLWSALKLFVWDKWMRNPVYQKNLYEKNFVDQLIVSIWVNYFKLPVDTMRGFSPNTNSSDYEFIRKYFFEREWWESYDLLEFILGELPAEWARNLTLRLNIYLEEENAAYRILDGQIVEITDEQELEVVDLALAEDSDSVRQHLSRSLELLSDKQSPDYRNSIKESISAVEAICQKVTGHEKATLGECLNMIESKSPLHPAFREALKKLYGYTSDEAGIRHSLKDSESEPSFGDAKFMLVTCSAFINYILLNASEGKIGFTSER